MATKDPAALLQSLVKLPKETEWLEFKQNQDSKEAIGKYVSALSNSALLSGEQRGFLVFGVEDETHEAVGTSVDLAGKTVGNESFLHWLNKFLKPAVQIEHLSFVQDGIRIEVLCVEPPYVHPVRFQDVSYIRIDSSLHKLSDHPAKEAALWQAVSRFSFERQRARSGMLEAEIIDKFFCDELTESLSPGRSNGDSISFLASHGLVERNLEGGFDPLNLLVLVSAKNFEEWTGYARKGIRLVSYKTPTKFERDVDILGKRGYFSSFPGAMSMIMRSIPNREELVGGVRRTVYDLPEIAIREILANAIVHQDLTDTSSGPLVEVFPDRVVVTNPGTPLVQPERFVDAPSRSRNTAFADMMRQLGVCEQRGSGIDRAFTEIEQSGLPPASVKVVEGSTVVTLYGPRKFANLTKDERIWACYWHASLCVERNDFMSNASLRRRFKLGDKQYPQVSEVISEAIDRSMIRPLSEDQANRNARYVPHWY